MLLLPRTLIPILKVSKTVIAPNQKLLFSPRLHSGLTCKAPRWNSG
ncbi:hypothetical protein SLEP1_g39401 [Rubroshorea leprosula]|uniref:Uncharacterized protein n=1 Tax=Rubroshorea leprosula TaxID=152421 RepID=A0AAV5L0K7_9ROSI|nr:hypothetical protein SLEP1_g39401 [Rubroshorea leprosula]